MFMNLRSNIMKTRKKMLASILCATDGRRTCRCALFALTVMVFLQLPNPSKPNYLNEAV